MPFRNTLAIVAFAAVCGIPRYVSAQEAEGYPRLMQGPMVGPVTPNEIVVWARANGPYDCWLEYSSDPDLHDAETSAKVTAQRSGDYTVQFRMAGLQPDTTYYYRVHVHEGVSVAHRGLPPFHAKTAPAGPARFRVTFGSCARIVEDPIQPIWGVVDNLDPDLFFWLGDNIYGDALDPGILAEEYRRQRDVPSYRPIMWRVPQLAVWDDHDYGLNDSDRTNPVKADALRVFKQYWPNPAYGLPDTPGVFFTYHYGGVDFFFLDGRYYRDPAAEIDGPDKTMLGKAQFDWLIDALEASDATFKVLICGSPWNLSYGPHGDSWAAYAHERQELFMTLFKGKVTGVFVLAGDTHWGALNCIPWADYGGYDVYELISSPLAQPTWDTAYQYVPEVRVRPPFTGGDNVGVIDFDLTANPPTATLQLYSHYGSAVWQPLVLTPADLQGHTQTWPDKITPEAEKANAWARAGRKATQND